MDDRRKGVLALFCEARVSLHHRLAHTHHVGNLAGMCAGPQEPHAGGPAQAVKDAILEQGELGIVLALSPPLVGQFASLPRRAVRAQEDESWTPFPCRKHL